MWISLSGFLHQGFVHGVLNGPWPLTPSPLTAPSHSVFRFPPSPSPQIACISAFSDPTPEFVLVSSAAVQRSARALTAEEREASIPIVKLNPGEVGRWRCGPPHRTTLHPTTLHGTTLHPTTLHGTTLHRTTLHGTTLHRAIPYCATKHRMHCAPPSLTALSHTSCSQERRLMRCPNTSPRVPLLPPSLLLPAGVLSWKLSVEDLLRASGLRYTVVRPCGLLNADNPTLNDTFLLEVKGRAGREAGSRGMVYMENGKLGNLSGVANVGDRITWKTARMGPIGRGHALAPGSDLCFAGKQRLCALSDCSVGRM